MSSKKEEELLEVHSQFVEDLCNILEATEYLKPLVIKMPKNQSDRWILEEKLNKRYLKLNANFLYMFSRFERFLVDVILSGTKINTLKKKLHQIYDNEAKKQIELKGDKIWAELINVPTKQIKDLNVLLEKKGSFKVALEMFDVDKKNEDFLKWFYLYSEGRERRNNITHHGTTPTAKYKKSMEEHFSRFQKSEKVIKTELYQHLKNNPREKRQDSENIYDLSITRDYLIKIFNALVCVSGFIVLGYASKPKDFYRRSIHGLLKLYEKFGLSIEESIDFICKFPKDFEPGLQDTFNQKLFLSIGINKIINSLNEKKKYIKNQTIELQAKLKEDLSKARKLKQSLKKEIQSEKFLSSKLINAQAEDYQYNRSNLADLLVAHLENKTLNMAKAANTLIKIKKEESSIFHWAIFSKFIEKPTFKEKVHSSFWK